MRACIWGIANNKRREQKIGCVYVRVRSLKNNYNWKRELKYADILSEIAV